jgi:ABC-type transport system substrate-binding protein
VNNPLTHHSSLITPHPFDFALSANPDKISAVITIKRTFTAPIHRWKAGTKKQWVRGPLLLILSALLAACDMLIPPPAPTPDPSPAPPLPPLAMSVDLDDSAVVVPIPIDPPSFNAYLNDTGYEALIGELVFGALAEIGPDGEFYPELAADLPTLANGGLSEDGTTVTWKLRPGILWSDGQPFTSADVRFTWDALKQSGIWAPGFDLIESIETPDETTAVVKYKEFYPNYLLQFGGNGTGVLPAHQCGDPGRMLFWDCNFEPVSTGPFVLAQWIPGVRLIFEPNPHYLVPDRPLSPQLVFEIVQDPELRQRSLIRGNQHLDLWPNADLIPKMEDGGTVTVIRTDPARYVMRLVLNLSDPQDPTKPHPILSNPQVRQAIYHAVDINYLNAEAFDNRGLPVETELYQLDCDLPPYHDYNPGLAQALLNEAGWVVVNPDPDSDVLRCASVRAAAPPRTARQWCWKVTPTWNLAPRWIKPTSYWSNCWPRSASSWSAKWWRAANCGTPGPMRASSCAVSLIWICGITVTLG